MGWGQILTLKNDPTCNFAPCVVKTYKIYWYRVGLTLKNDPMCISAPRVFLRYKLHWDEVGSNLKLIIFPIPLRSTIYSALFSLSLSTAFVV